MEEPIGLYKVGDKVDGKDLKMGAWFEAQIKKVTRGSIKEGGTSSQVASGIVYHVTFDE